MSFFSEAQETASRYGKYIPEFQELFRSYEVSFGTSKDFLRLPSKLAYDGDFRVEFSALTKSVGEREEGRLSLMQMLTIIAIATGGTEIEEVGSAGAVPISLLVVFLSEIGGWHEEPESVGVAESGGDDESEAAELERQLAQGHKDGMEGVAASLFSGPGLMKEALSRLELNTLQLKLHLDSIDTRMERIEPHLDDLTWKYATRGEAATEERKTGTSDERPARFSPEMRAWPKRREEEPESSWEMPAPSIRPFPVDRERDLAPEATRESLVETSAPRPAADWRSAVASLQERERQESMLRTEMPEPVLEPESIPVPEPEFMPEPVLRSSVPEAPLREPELEPISKLSEPVKEFVPEPLLREPLVKESVPEPLLREPSVRVPFGEYLRDEDEEFSERRWGRWVLAALLLIGVAGGAMVYRSQGWQGFIDGWQHGKALAGTAATKTRLAMDEAKGLSAKPAPSATQTQSTEPVGSAGTAPAAQSSTSPVPAQPAPTQAAPVAGAAQPPASTTQTAAAPAEATRKTATPERIRAHVVIEESGVNGGGASSNGEATAAPVPSAARVFGGTAAPAFVDASRLTVLSKTQPEYPNDAAAQKITGDVVVQAIVSQTGAVESAQIVSGPPGLLKASLDAMKSWRYQPYLVNGEPVEVRTYVKFRFERDE